jgi:hypothetical protein
MYLLPPEKYDLIKPLIDNVTFNCLYARSVVTNHVNGTIFVDNINTPRNCYILHPYGMSLLLGDANNSYRLLLTPMFTRMKSLKSYSHDTDVRVFFQYGILEIRIRYHSIKTMPGI